MRTPWRAVATGEGISTFAELRMLWWVDRTLRGLSAGTQGFSSGRHWLKL